MSVYAVGESAAAQKTPEAIKEAGSKVAAAVLEAGENLLIAQVTSNTPITRALYIYNESSQVYMLDDEFKQELAPWCYVPTPTDLWCQYMV